MKKLRQTLASKLPNNEDGIAIKTYFEINLKYLKRKFGMAFLIFDKLSSVIVDMDKKKEIITEFIPISQSLQTGGFGIFDAAGGFGGGVGVGVFAPAEKG